MAARPRILWASPDLDALSRRTYDVAVVGAGINGAAIARDAARRRVVVVDKDDVGSGTSAWLLGRTLPLSTTDREPLPGAALPGAPPEGADWPAEAARLRDELPWPDEVVDRLLAVEGAVHLTDVLHRRTMIGLEPGWGREIHREVAELAAPLRGWSADDVRREVAAHDTYVTERLLGGVEKSVVGVPG